MPPVDTIQSFGKGLLVMEYIVSADQSSSISEMSRSLGINKTTIYRLLRTLEETNYVEQDTLTGRYRPTMKILMFSNKLLNKLEIRNVAHNDLEALARQSGHSIHLAVRDKAELVIIDKLDDSENFGVRFHIGRRSPLYCTGLGKIFLSSMKPDELDNYLKTTTRIQHTDTTMVKEEHLRHEIEKVRSCGYAFDIQEHNQGISCLATSLRDYQGHTVAAISITGASFRIEPQIEELVPSIMTCAKKISAKLGHG